MDNTTLFFQIFNLGSKSPVFDALMIFGAKYLIFISLLFFLILGVFGSTKERKSPPLIIGSFVFSILIIYTIRIFYTEPRPFVTYNINPLVKHAADAAFPSVHTTIMAIVTFSYHFYKSKFTAFFLVLMLWVGLARIFVGVHYPLDVLGGIITGLISVQLSWTLKNQLIKKLFSAKRAQ